MVITELIISQFLGNTMIQVCASLLVSLLIKAPRHPSMGGGGRLQFVALMQSYYKTWAHHVANFQQSSHYSSNKFVMGETNDGNKKAFNVVSLKALY